MKIAVMIDQLVPGGIQKVAIEEVRFLRKIGCDATLLVITEKLTNQYFYGDLTDDVPIEFVSGRFPRILRWSFKFPFFAFFSSFHVTSPLLAPIFFSKKDFDSIICHGTYTCFTARQLWKRRSIPYIAFVHDPIAYILPHAYSGERLSRFFFFLLPLARFLDKMIVKDAMLSLTYSIHAKYLSELTGKDPVVVHHGCYPESSIPGSRGDFVLAATKWDTNKKPKLLLEILKRTENHLKLVVAGSWASEALLDDFMKKVSSDGLDQRVEITNSVSEEALRDMYKEARVLVHPITEGFGMTVLEAAAHGCPSIVAKGSGVTDLFMHGKHGFQPPEFDLEAYAVYLDKLAADERLAWKMGHEAWTVARENTWENHADRLLELIESAGKSPSRVKSLASG